ncbi:MULTISPECIES: carbohydrate ABC transporter permease [Streptomyces]|uniref:Sugar ABC transporter permease n=1 Tax=Streptomyces thermoviolaceus subsp. thermoviolaceus TaxID=66860 RepID=A0ABX0YS10_STRTL|nr:MULTISPECIES: sugar ABC transporter permease [Streptomyces]MCM3265086.1 sugar ABC transporter permease [Streptomyces thermoviolaceus]NJP15355.1 sugar ABC transporter permease [Streptomyces thermoviolaceus subsp. thermoviolaceus]RSR99411.1 sugar ABC transporter permease [Streptomyces sp. WAC00469]WTD50647.1 sugar ABC transporter permease [Streptomyces thermoviolaceus]GGV76261.1 ABC transporter permease [Streptomyces thermoviolaceus subsp. apingens]
MTHLSPAADGGRTSRRGAAARHGRIRSLTGVLFVSPYVLFVLAVFAVPLVYTVWISVHRFYFTAPGTHADSPWVGLSNYRDVFTDPVVGRAFVNIVVFLVINVPLTVILSLVLASALNAKIRFRSFFRAAYYLPYITASVALVAVWQFLFGTDGFVNHALGPLAPDPSWLVNAHLAMPMIAFFVTWKQLGFFVMLYLAALQNVGKELYEAAAVDGAGRIRQFFSVTVPGVRPATTLVVIYAIITGANLFSEPYLLTGGGGPDHASVSPVLLMYQKGIEQGHPDFAAALGVVLVCFVLLISLAARKLTERGT